MALRRDNYILIHGWMSVDLKLKGISLMIYAIIYGFSQDGESYYKGGLKYLEEWSNATKRGVIKALNKMVDDGIIFKHDATEKGIKITHYKCAPREALGVVNFVPGVVNLVPGGSELSSNTPYIGRNINIRMGKIQFSLSRLKNFKPILSEVFRPNKPPKKSSKRGRFIPPTVEEIEAYCAEKKYHYFNAPYFIDYYNANGWMAGKNRMKDWKATVNNWYRRDNRPQPPKPTTQPTELTPNYFNEID